MKGKLEPTERQKLIEEGIVGMHIMHSYILVFELFFKLLRFFTQERI